MSEGSNGTIDQPQNDSRENLFYFLQTLSRQAQTNAGKAREESPNPNEQIEAHITPKGLRL